MVVMAWPAPPPGEPGYEEPSLALEVLEGGSLAPTRHREEERRKRRRHARSRSPRERRVARQAGRVDERRGRRRERTPRVHESDPILEQPRRLRRSRWSARSRHSKLRAPARRPSFTTSTSSASRTACKSMLRRIQRVKPADLGSAAEQLLVDGNRATIVTGVHTPLATAARSSSRPRSTLHARPMRPPVSLGERADPQRGVRTG